jgi:hypothetical protein
LYLHYLLLLLHSHYLPLRCSFGPAEEDDYFQEHLNTLGFNIKSSYEFEEEGTVGGDDNKVSTQARKKYGQLSIEYIPKLTH